MPANGSSKRITAGLVASPIAMSERAEMAVRQIARNLIGVGGKPQEGEDLVGGAAEGNLVGPRLPRAQIVAEEARLRPELMGDHDIVAHAHAPEDRRLLEGTDHTLSCHPVRSAAGDALAAEADAAGTRGQEGGDQLEEGGFSRPVRPDDGEDLAFLHMEGDAIHGGEPTEAFGDVINFENGFGHRTSLRRPSERRPFGRASMKAMRRLE